MENEVVANTPVSFEEISEELQYFGDIPLGITVQLDERRMKIRDILQLQAGSVISLPKSAGENVDIVINGRTVAFGEVVRLEGSTGIRITELDVPD
jgi:flagellar motor switch protein FliN/FliY